MLKQICKIILEDFLSIVPSSFFYVFVLLSCEIICNFCSIVI